MIYIWPDFPFKQIKYSIEINTKKLKINLRLYTLLVYHFVAIIFTNFFFLFLNIDPVTFGKFYDLSPITSEIVENFVELSL